MINEIIETAVKTGMDNQSARDLHSYLCRDDSLAASFAAELVSEAIEHYQKADQILKRLCTLCEENNKKGMF